MKETHSIMMPLMTSLPLSTLSFIDTHFLKKRLFLVKWLLVPQLNGTYEVKYLVYQNGWESVKAKSITNTEGTQLIILFQIFALNSQYRRTLSMCLQHFVNSNLSPSLQKHENVPILLNKRRQWNNGYFLSRCKEGTKRAIPTTQWSVEVFQWR